MKKTVKSPFATYRRGTKLFFATLGLAFFLLPFAAYWNSHAAGTYSGRVFKDYNGNGTYNTAGDATNPAIDAGVQSVTVTLYDSAGAAQGTANTAADGTFSIAATGTGPYRVEYTNLPSGFQPSARSTDSVDGGTTATDAGSTVQFVANGGDTNINLALDVPDDYCQNNPLICNAMYVVGNVDGTALHTFPYNYSSELDGNLGGTWTTAPSRDGTLAPSSIGTNANLGATYGLAWDRFNNRVFASAYVKRGARQGGLSSESTGAIFVKNTPSSASPAATVYVDLNTVFGAGTTGANPHPVATTSWVNADPALVDPATLAVVGKRGLGDLEISKDGANLYTVNLTDRRLYVIPTSGTLNSTTITRFDVPTSGLATSSGNCNAADVRPFGLGRDSSGNIYVGGVCSAESETADTKLHLYVWRFDNPGFTLVLNRSLSNFTRNVGTGADLAKSWQRWSDTVSGLNIPEPSLADIDFDGTAMVLGIRDRYADKVVFPDYVRGYGDIMRACLVSGSYTFENNGTCGGTTTGGAGISQSYGDTFAAIAYNGTTGTTSWSSTPWTEIGESDGASAGSVTVIASTTTNALRVRDNFGISRAVTLTGPSAPLLTFNYLRENVGASVEYFDGSAWQVLLTIAAATDTSFQSAAVQLPLTATAIRFMPPNVAGTNYFHIDNVAIAGADGPGGGEYYIDLNGDGREEGMMGSLLQIPGHNSVMTIAYDPVTYNSAGTRVSNFYTAGVQKYNNTTGVMTGAYDVYLDADVNNFGKANGIGDIEALCDRAPIELGNRVWRDTDNDGVQDPGENGISGVTVRLYNASNTLIATAVTDANGEYYFTSGTAVDGNITDNIGIVNGQITPNTNYQIRADLAANYTGAGVLNGLLMTTRDQTSQLGFDDGSDSDSSLVTNPTSSPAGTYPVIAITTGSAGDNNHNYDIGFASSTTYSIGNRVWFDTNNDGQINAGEVGISGVSVSLFLDANVDGTPDTPGTPVGTQSTDVNGYYRFDTLAANSYVVRINSSNFANAGVLGGYANTTGSNNTDTDSTSVAGQNGENGINPSGAANTVQTNGILSGSITLGAPGEPVSEADVQASGQGSTDAAANMTVDFGFYRACIGDVVWNDNGAGANNNNGVLNAGEAGIPSVRVQLYDSANAEILVGPDGRLGTSDDATNGMLTNSSGIYSLCGMAPGQYRVVVTTPGGSSSTPTSNNPDDNVNSDDNGFPGTAPFAGRTVSGLVTVTPGSTGALTNKTVTNSTGITNDPTVDFGFVLPPTAVNLDKFEVTTDGGAVSLSWSTGDESGNLGFNIYRETNGVRELITPAPIAGSALKSSANLVVSGGEYNWVDKDARLGAVYYLEDLDINGNRTTYGPVTPMFKVSLSKFEKDAVLVSDLANIPNASAQKEFVNKPTENASLNPSRQFEVAAQSGVKISINHDGWYRVSAEQLTANGFDINSNRANWQLYVGGEQIEIKVATDGSIEFFGRGADTAETDRNVYYLVNGQNNGLRLTEVKGGRTGANQAAAYVSTVQRKDRSIYVSSLLNGESENWFGSVVSNGSQTIQTLSLNNIQENSMAQLQVKLQGLTSSAHFVNVRINNTDLGQINFDGMENHSIDFDVPASALVEGVNSVKLQSVGAGDVSLVDTVSLSYSRLFRAVNNQIRFSLPAGQTVKVGGFTNGRIAINEIRDGKVGVRYESPIVETDGEFGFELGAAGRTREFLAVSILQNEQPATVERNMPSTLNSSENRADLVIIVPAMFQNQARQLSDMRQAQGLKSKVVFAEDVADEFGYGVLSADSLKRFLENAVSNWNEKPHYAILFGDSSYDQRNYLNQVNRNLIPTKLVDTDFMETSGDSWLADFDGDSIEDIALGRLPAANVSEAELLIAKLARYDQQPARTEKTAVLPSDHTFESYIQVLHDQIPNDVNVIRIDRDQMTDAEMHNRIITALNDNAMVTAYLGHGSTGIWAASSVFNINDVNALNNSQLGFFMLTTCLNGYTHNAYSDSLAETALKNANGGAIAVWASSGTNFPTTQTSVSQAAIRMIFNAEGTQLRIGDIVRLAKQSTDDRDVRRNYLLLGDPTIFVK